MKFLRWSTFLLGSLSVPLTVPLFWISFILLLVFVMEQLSLYWEILINIFYQFPWTFFQAEVEGGGGSFSLHRFDYLYTDWNCLHNHLRGEQRKYIFKVSAFAAAATTELCKWVQFERDVYIPQGKYQVKPYSSPWNLVACAAAIAHTN